MRKFRWESFSTSTRVTQLASRFPGDSVAKNLPANAEETRVPSLGREDPLEEGTATHSSILAWRTPWTEEPDGLQSLGWQKDKTEATEQLTTVHI